MGEVPNFGSQWEFFGLWGQCHSAGGRRSKPEMRGYNLKGSPGYAGSRVQDATGPRGKEAGDDWDNQDRGCRKQSPKPVA